MTQRGDVVIVALPYVSGAGGKNRPALIIQGDRNNQRLQNTIVAMITGNIRMAAAEPTQLLIDPAIPAEKLGSVPRDGEPTVKAHAHIADDFDLFESGLPSMVQIHYPRG